MCCMDVLSISIMFSGLITLNGEPLLENFLIEIWDRCYFTKGFVCNLM